MPPITVSSVASLTSRSLLIEVSKVSRSRATPKPDAAARATIPSAMLRTGLGLIGPPGMDGGRTTETFTGLGAESDTRSSSRMLVENC